MSSIPRRTFLPELHRSGSITSRPETRHTKHNSTTLRWSIPSKVVRDLVDLREHKARQGQQDHRDLPVHKVPRALQVHRELKASLARPAQRVRRDKGVLRDRRDPKVLPERQDPPVLRASLVRQGPSVRQVPQGHKALRASQDPRVRRVLRVTLVPQDLLDRLVRPGLKEPQDPLGRRATTGSRGLLDPKAPQGHQVLQE